MPYVIWDINPEIIQIGPLHLRWYGLLFTTSIFLSYFLLRKNIKNEGLNAAELEPLLFYVVIGTIVGARLGHCLFYNPSYYLSNPLEIPQFWLGGLASHGGVLGILGALFIFSRIHRQYSFLWLTDKIALVAGMNGFFIRLGNLFNSELIGTPTTVSWAFIFKSIDEVPRHPVQLYESLTYGAIFIMLMVIYHRYKDKIGSGFISGLFFTCVFAARFALEFFKTHQAEYNTDWALRTGQLLSIPLCILGIGLIIHSFRSIKGFSEST